MAVDIGIDAVDLNSYDYSNNTFINMSRLATISGLVTSIEIWANANITGLRVGTFYTTNGNTLKCRDSEAIAGTITAGSKVTKTVSIAVEIGDYIGCYFTGGQIELATSGYDGFWFLSGEHIDPGDEATYGYGTVQAVSLGGYIPIIGWTGKISGVTNPAKIMGVDVANIAKVKGVS